MTVKTPICLLMMMGLLIAALSVPTPLSGVISGHLSDRIGYKPIFYASSVLSTVFLLLLLFLPGQWILFNAFMSGFFIMSILPLTITMGQELAPKGRSIVSSLMMGLAFGIGGVMTPLAGHFADLFSIRPVLTWIAFFPVLMIPLIYFLPETKRIVPRTVWPPLTLTVFSPSPFPALGSGQW